MKRGNRNRNQNQNNTSALGLSEFADDADLTSAGYPGAVSALFLFFILVLSLGFWLYRTEQYKEAALADLRDQNIRFTDMLSHSINVGEHLAATKFENDSFARLRNLEKSFASQQNQQVLTTLKAIRGTDTADSGGMEYSILYCKEPADFGRAYEPRLLLRKAMESDRVQVEGPVEAFGGVWISCAVTAPGSHEGNHLIVLLECNCESLIQYWQKRRNFLIFFSIVVLFFAALAMLRVFSLSYFQTRKIAELREQIRDLAGLEKRFQTIARRVQRFLEPGFPPLFPPLKIAAKSNRHAEDGGDYYDFLKRPGNRLAIYVSDTGGQPETKPFVNLIARHILHDEMEGNAGPAETLAYLNRRLSQILKPGLACAASITLIDPATKVLLHSGIGMPGAILIPAGKKDLIDIPGESGFIGLHEQLTLKEIRFDIKPGDKLILCSSGVFETRRNSKVPEEFGLVRLQEILLSHGNLDIEALVVKVYDELALWTAGEQNMRQDVSIVGLEYLSGKNTEPK